MSLEVSSGQVLQVKGGAIPHKHFIGKTYGTKVSVARCRDTQRRSLLLCCLEFHLVSERGVPLSKLPLSMSAYHVLGTGVHYEWEGVGMRSPPNAGVVDGDPPPPHTDSLLGGH